MFKCHKCNKIYKRENALIKHEIKCQNKSKNTRPSLDKMWHIILKQQKQLAEQKKEIEKLKNIVNKDVKTIDMLDWLKENVERNLNYSDWIKRHIEIKPQHMKLIMKNNYKDSVPSLLNQLKYKDKNLVPIFCFNHTSKVIYIYENSWKKASQIDIKMIFDEINLQLLKHNIEYEKTLDDKTLHSKSHLENNEKLIITHHKKKECIINKIKQEIYNLLKIDLNELNKYKFYI